MDKRKREKHPYAPRKKMWHGTKNLNNLTQKKKILAANNKGSYYDKEEWLQECLRLGLYDEETEKIENYNTDSEDEETCDKFSETEVLVAIFRLYKEAIAPAVTRT